MSEYNCNLNSDGWQLYNGPEGDQAAEVLSTALTAKVKASLQMLEDQPLFSASKLAVKVRDEMYQLMNQFINEGARDTEPECVLVDELERAFKLEPYSLSR